MQITVHLSRGGSVVVPANIRKKLNLKEGTALVIEVRGTGIRLTPVHEAINRIQALAKKLLDSHPYAFGGADLRTATGSKAGLRKRNARMNSFVLDASALLALVQKEARCLRGLRFKSYSPQLTPPSAMAALRSLPMSE